MTLRIPEREQLPTGLVSQTLPVDRVLYEAESPVVYLTHTEFGQQLVAYVADDNQEGTFTVLAPISRESLARLEGGSLSARDALTSSWMWLHVTAPAGNGLWPTSIEDLADGHLPNPSTPLYPEHTPLLRTRAIGERVEIGRMPASVVAFVADSTRKAIKILLDNLLMLPSEGRPREEHRALYDLPIQNFAFASFELSFGMPDEGLFPREQLREAAKKLECGLAWASSIDSAPLTAESDAERESILRAALLLTPPQAGVITEVQVSGLWIQRGSIRLTRDSRRRVRQELRNIDSERVMSYTGRIGEIDVDNSSFILRDVEDGQDRRGFYNDDLLDDMITFFADAQRVAVAGVERLGRLYVSAVAPAAEEAASSDYIVENS
jgi:hypothetical protein